MDEPELSESGNPIYRYNKDQENKFTPASGDGENIDAIDAHITQHIGPVEMVFHEIVSDQVHIDIHWVKATAERPYHVLVTSGMSDKSMNTPQEADIPQHLELCMLLPVEWKIDEKSFKDENNYWPIRWMKIIARFPHQYNTWVGWGHTIPNGENAAGFASATKLGCMILLPSLNLPHDFFELKTGSKTIAFFCLYPLYKEEMDFKLKNGTDRLLDKFEEAGISDIVDINRPNSCAPQKKGLFGLW
ncbi:MAG TPA: suppressor of fused domain protein [Cyclobacteriaceae bacterium]|nr:suppressor of fused domain protein [Cyclobacteriaceae bacterium]